MMSLGEFLIQKNLQFTISGNFDSEKVDQDDIFIIKISSNDPNIIHIQKIIFGVCHTTVTL